MEYYNTYNSDGVRLQSYWAYIHTDDRSHIRVKPLIADPGLFYGGTYINDLDAAIEEKQQGNDLIWAICKDIIWAENTNQAVHKAAKWFITEGYQMDKDGQWQFPLRKGGRFAHLQVE